MPNSRSTRVVWLLEELGAPYDVTPMTREDRKTEEHLGRHPLGRVPVVDDGEGPIFESLAILLHLGDLHPDSGVLPPPGTHERALVYQWCSVGMTELEPALLELWAARRAGDGEREAAALERFLGAARAVDAALGDGDFLVGSRFTVADLVCGAVLLFAKRLDIETITPGIDAYLERLDTRPARQRAVAVGT
jgi:glutathione S-transferase